MCPTLWASGFEKIGRDQQSKYDQICDHLTKALEGDQGCENLPLFSPRKHIPAALYKCLGGFATNGVNLTKLESRPHKTEKSGYLYYLDLAGHPEDPNVKEALRDLHFFAAFVKMLGSYPNERFDPLTGKNQPLLMKR